MDATDWYARVVEELRDSHDTHAHELLQEMIDAIDDGDMGLHRLMERFRQLTGIAELAVEINNDGWSIRFSNGLIGKSWDGLTYDDVERLLREAIESGAADE